MSVATVILVLSLVLVAVLVARRLKPLMYEEQRYLFQVYEGAYLVSEHDLSGSYSEVSLEIDRVKEKMTKKQHYVLRQQTEHSWEVVERSPVRL